MKPGGEAIGVAQRPDQATGMLADLLVEQGHCDLRTIDRARRVAAESGQRLDRVLIQLGLIGERGLAEAFAALLGLKLTGPDRYPAEPLLADRLTGRFLRSARALPLAIENEILVVAAADPLDAFLAPALGAATGRPIALEVAVPIELDAAFDRLYPDGPAAAEEAAESTPGEPSEEDAERLKDLASEAPVIRLVNQIISRAVETQASDIHIEPFEDRLRVRYRYDGVLHEAEAPPSRLTAAITSRIKIMARLDIAERRLPQDGRIRLAVRGQDVDLRVSTIPSLHGETVVLRVLDRNAMIFEYSQLGLPPNVVERFSDALSLPTGIVLVTGPTGSGKTTTLYTALGALNSVTRKIMTIEDPIEYQLNGITQIQVKPQIGLSFASLLRYVVRQDSNLIMVGEIRDLETAEIAAQAALIGRLVLATLHTNSAAATVTRLREMGLEDYLISTVLRGVLAQRLVRRLCLKCRGHAEAPVEIIRRFRLDQRLAALAESDLPVVGGLGANSENLGGERRIMLWHPVGCSDCRYTGYRGRLAIAEFLELNAEIRRLIFARAEHSEIERAAVAAGMVTMFDSGVKAALEGLTTIEEVVGSVRAEA